MKTKTTTMTNWHAILVHPVWAILPSSVSQALFTENNGQPQANVSVKLPPKALQPMMQSHIAILPIGGVILPHANGLSQCFGATTLDQLTEDVQKALQNPHVSEIILTIDSPGGVVTGVHECAEMIYQARGKKPITAYVSGMGASAAYWLASSCDEIVCDATASVGSIGVLSIYTDDTQQKAQQGLSQIQIVSSQSPRKRLDVATEEGRAEIQAQVDAIADVFVTGVARNRKVSPEAVLADFGQGSLLVGIQAVKQGLADRLGSLQQLIQEKTASHPKPKKSLPPKTLSYQPKKKGTLMNETRETLLASITIQDLVQCAPDLVNTLREEGVFHERERIRDIEALGIPGHDALIQKLKWDGTTADAAAKQILMAEKTRHADKLNQLQAHSLGALPITRSVIEEGTDTKPPQKALSLEAQCQLDWQNDAGLHAEFGAFDTYFAFMKADTNGQINWLGRPDK